ncbi:pantothenate transporter [Seiridium cupressi]
MGGFTAARTCLGFVEGAVTPAFAIIASMWYKKSEHALRTAFNGVAQVVGALAIFGVGSASNLAIASWRVMFLVCGGGTIAAGIAFLVFMPQSPETVWFLTEREQSIAVQRMSLDCLSKEGRSFSWTQILEFVKDHRAWLLVLATFFNTLASPVLKFATLVIGGFGWSKLNTMLSIITTIPPLIGNISVAALPRSSQWGIVVCTWMATILSPFMVVVLSLIASKIKGNTKKCAASNGYFIFYAAAAIAGPQLWTKGPRYTDGVIADLVSLGCNVIICMSFWPSASGENVRRDKLGLAPTEASNADITDEKDLGFRYTF